MIEFRRDAALGLAVALGGDVRDRAASRRTARFDLADEGAGGVAAIGDDVTGAREAGDQRRRSGLVAGLAGGRARRMGRPS